MGLIWGKFFSQKRKVEAFTFNISETSPILKYFLVGVVLLLESSVFSGLLMMMLI
jgi:hypothetical protein